MDKILTSEIKHGSAVLNGVDGLLRATKTMPPLPRSEFTLGLWLKIASGNGAVTAAVKANNLYSLDIYNNSPSLWVNMTVGSWQRVNTGALAYDTWHALTYTLKDNVLSSYVGGELVASSTVTGALVTTGIGTPYLGSYAYPADGRTFKGSLDEVYLLDYALTDKQVKAQWRDVRRPEAGMVFGFGLNGNGRDISANANHANIEGGVSWSEDAPASLAKRRALATGLAGSASFDGATGKITVPHQAVLNPATNQLTAGGWFSCDPHFSNAFRKDGLFTFDTGAGGGLVCYINLSSRTDGGTVGWQGASIPYDKAAMGDGRFFHAAITYDGATLRNYVNGVEVAQRAWAGTLNNSTGSVTMGLYSTAYYKGLLAAPFLFDRVLSTDELKRYMYSLIPADTPGLLEQWVLNGNATGTKGNHGTVTGGVSWSAAAPRRLRTSKASTAQRSGLVFNGTTSKITTSNIVLNDFVFTCWFRKDSSKVSSFLSNAGSNVIGLDATNNLTFLGLSGGVSYSIHKTWNYLVVTREAGVVKAKINNNAFVTIGTDSTSITINEIGNLFDGIISAPALFNIGTATGNQYNYLSTATPNLVEQWRLNEGIGTMAYGTKGNNGTIANTTWTNSSSMNWKNKVAKFNGIDSFIDAGSNIQLSKTSFTIEFWSKLNVSVLPSSGIRDHFMVQQNEVIEAYKVLHIGYRLFADGGTNMYFSFHSSTYAYTYPLTDMQQWHHYAYCFDKSTKLLSHYRDGLLIGSVTLPYTFIGVAPLQFGRYHNSYAAVSIDEIRIWDSVRTSIDIEENYNKSISRHPNLVLNMNFDSNLTYDSSGHNNHGTVVGGVIQDDSNNDKLLFNSPINLSDIPYQELTYDFNSTSNFLQSSNTKGNVGGSALTPNYISTWEQFTGVYPTSVLRVSALYNTSSVSSAKSTGTYFEFVTTGFLYIRSLELEIARGGTSGSRGFGIATSKDNYATLRYTEDAIPEVRPNLGKRYIPLDITHDGSPLTIRIYIATSASGYSIEIDNIKVSGSVQ